MHVLSDILNNPSQLTQATEALIRGDLVAIPTETVYGLAGNAFSNEAVAKIFRAKERPTFDPLIVHVSPELNTLEKLEEAGIIDLSSGLNENVYTPESRKTLQLLINHFWPGPLTLILKRGPRIAELVSGGLDTVGVRMPAHPVAQKLLSCLDFPLAAPSANRFGRTSPVTSAHVITELGDKVDWVVEGGPCAVGVESTVLLADPGTTSHRGKFKILRPGGVTHEALHPILGEKLSPLSENDAFAPNAAATLLSPGVLIDHYAPSKPLFLLNENGPLAADLVRKKGFIQNQTVAVLFRSRNGHEKKLYEFESTLQRWAQPSSVETFFLSKNGEDLEGAQNLFAKIREMDQSKAQILFAEPWLDHAGLGVAIQDRLMKASLNKGALPPPTLTLFQAGELALELATFYRGQTSPNPPVGAVALDSQNRLLGGAAHQRAGTDHAEAALCREAHIYGYADQVDTVVVTLEPCNHHGRTPPCSKTLLQSFKNLKRVAFLAKDPNPRVLGGGETALSRSVQVTRLYETEPELAARAQDLIAPFSKWVTTGLPFITVKKVQRRDPLTQQWTQIPPPGQTTFSNARSLKLAHELRRRSDAILTGSGTILADHPSFTVRHVKDFDQKKRHVFILDRRGRVETQAAEWLKLMESKGFLIAVQKHENLQEAFKKLGELGCLEVLVEAGPTLTRAVLDSGFCDQLVLISCEKDQEDRVCLQALSQTKALS